MSDYFNRKNEDVHLRADTDADALALHHTLGKSPNQAAPGNHNHIFPRQKVLFTANQAIPAVTWTKLVNWLYIDNDRSSSFNWAYPMGGTFEIPENGWYTIHSSALIVLMASTQKINYAIKINGEYQNVNERSIAANVYESIDVYWEGNCNKGDLVTFYIHFAAAGTVYGSGLMHHTSIAMRKVSERY